MIEFYRLPSDSPSMRKVMLMLAETGLEHRVELIERRGDGPCEEPYASISPACTAPAIVDRETGAKVFESGAILHYLADKASMLLPTSEPARAHVLKWLFFEVANVGPVMVEIYHQMLSDEGAEAGLLRQQERMASTWAIIDKQLEGREFIADELSIADIALYPWSLIVEDMAGLDLQELPNVARWMRQLGARPAFASL